MSTELHIEYWSPEEATPSGGWWAVCDRCDDDAGPYPPVALFRRKDDANAYITARDPDDSESPLVFDACVAPAGFLLDGTLVVGNDYRIGTHDELFAALPTSPEPEPDVEPPVKPPSRRERFERHLTAAINSCSAENGSNTPDFILAEFAAGCIDAFDRASRSREKWYGVELRPGKDRPSIGSPCESCGGATVCLGDDWACVKCGRHGSMAAVGVGGE